MRTHDHFVGISMLGFHLGYICKTRSFQVSSILYLESILLCWLVWLSESHIVLPFCPIKCKTLHSRFFLPSDQNLSDQNLEKRLRQSEPVDTLGTYCKFGKDAEGPSILDSATQFFRFEKFSVVSSSMTIVDAQNCNMVLWFNIVRFARYCQRAPQSSV